MVVLITVTTTAKKLPGKREVFKETNLAGRIPIYLFLSSHMVDSPGL